MKCLIFALVSLIFSTAVSAADRISRHAQKTLEIYRAIVEMDSSKKTGDVARVANYLATELRQADFPKKDVEVVPVGEASALITHYRGDGSTDMNSDEKFAHGLNERLPIDAFYAALDHWSIILKELAGKRRKVALSSE